MSHKPGRKTPGLATLRENRVNAAKEPPSFVSHLISVSKTAQTASLLRRGAAFRFLISDPIIVLRRIHSDVNI